MSSSQQSQVTKEDLVELVQKYENRTLSEDIDLIQQKGGDGQFCGLLQVQIDQGISSGEVESRRAQYGSNHPASSLIEEGFFRLLRKASEDTMLRILLFIAVVCILRKACEKNDEDQNDPTHWINGYALFAMVGICILVEAWNSYQKQNNLKNLNEVFQKKKVKVWRDGQLKEIYDSELVTGDVVKITDGMILSADMMLLQAHTMTVDESALNKKGKPNNKSSLARKRVYQECLESKNTFMEKDEQSLSSPILLSGTTVLTGEGKAVVLVVGKVPCRDLINISEEDSDEKSTPLQAKLWILAEDAGKYGILAAAITFVVFLVRFFIERFQTGTVGELRQYFQLINYFALAIAVVIITIPENLSLTLSNCFAYAIPKMLNKGIFLRKLDAIESMGYVENIVLNTAENLAQSMKTLTSFLNIEECRQAGVKVRMMTEDDKAILGQTAKELNILNPDSLVMSGSEFMKKIYSGDATLEETSKILQNLDLLTNASPDDKKNFIASLQKKGFVAVNGERTTDISVLKTAHIGIASGSATENVQETVDIVFSKENLNGTIDLVRWGRNLHENVAKLVQFQRPVSIVATVVIVVGAFLLREPVFTVVQLLWISLILDDFASFTFATEFAYGQDFRKQPYNKIGNIMTNTIQRQIYGQTIYQFSVIMFLVFFGDKNEEVKDSSNFVMAFNTFVFMQVFNLLNCRRSNNEINIFKGIKQNLYFIGVISFIVIIQVLIIGLFYDLKSGQWFLSISLASGSLLCSSFLKLASKGSEKSDSDKLKKD